MINRISRVLFILILVELCLGGGGRFTAIGPVSMRMILFLIAILLSVILFAQKKSLPIKVSGLLIGFVIVILTGITIGLINQNPKNLVFEDVKPLCYFLILPF